MNKKLFTAGMVSLSIALIFVLLNLTKIETAIGNTFLVDVVIYPAAFFALVGAYLIFLGLRAIWKH